MKASRPKGEKRSIENNGSRRLLFVCPEDRFFLTHFLERAISAHDNGYEVIVAAPPVGTAMAKIVEKGIQFIPLRLKRHGVNPLVEAKSVYQLIALYRHLRPTIVHHIGLKLIIQGTIAARWSGVPHIVNAPVGMGFVFSSFSLKAKYLRPLINMALRRTLSAANARVIFENPEDLAQCLALGAVTEGRAKVIRGAGVNSTSIHPVPERTSNIPVVCLAGRMLWAKGVGIFVEAARLLKQQGVAVRCVLVGGTDFGNLGSVPEGQIRIWENEGVIEWLGFVEDINPIFREANIVCLPSHYREGLPKVLLEAMANARAVIASDTVGCREAVTDGDNGLLVPPQDPVALAYAIRRLMTDDTMRLKMAARGRERIIDEFDTRIVTSATLAVYDEFFTTS